MISYCNNTFKSPLIPQIKPLNIYKFLFSHKALKFQYIFWVKTCFLILFKSVIHVEFCNFLQTLIYDLFLNGIHAFIGLFLFFFPFASKSILKLNYNHTEDVYRFFCRILIKDLKSAFLWWWWGGGILFFEIEIIDTFKFSSK